MERTHARGISCCIWLTLFSCEGDIEASFVQMGVYTTLLIPFIFSAGVWHISHTCMYSWLS
jgi:hypothetical protein